jgi:hypothetical protein
MPPQLLVMKVEPAWHKANKYAFCCGVADWRPAPASLTVNSSRREQWQCSPQHERERMAQPAPPPDITVCKCLGAVERDMAPGPLPTGKDRKRADGGFPSPGTEKNPTGRWTRMRCVLMAACDYSHWRIFALDWPCAATRVGIFALEEVSGGRGANRNRGMIAKARRRSVLAV